MPDREMLGEEASRVALADCWSHVCGTDCIVNVIVEGVAYIPVGECSTVGEGQRRVAVVSCVAVYIMMVCVVVPLRGGVDQVGVARLCGCCAQCSRPWRLRVGSWARRPLEGHA